MFSPKRLMKAASLGRRKILSSTFPTTEKGHFVVYTVDRIRFMIPLSYLEHSLFQELLRLSEEEFGTSSDSPITLVCDAVSLENMVMLIKTGVTQDLEIKAMLDSISSLTCSDFTSNQESVGQNMVICDC